jgi:hypothetical protein
MELPVTLGKEPVDKEILEGETRLMNIFYLHPDPLTAAEMHCDKHCVKMILETAQMLCTAHRALDGDKRADKLGMYKTAHLNHPSTKWVRGSLLQYEWTYHLFKFLCDEYTHRYNKVHKTDVKLREVLKEPPYFLRWVLRDSNPPLVPSSSINTYTQPPQCMPDQYKVPDDAVQAYRNYYIGEKASFAKWAYTRTPEWWTVH